MRLACRLRHRAVPVLIVGTLVFPACSSGRFAGSPRVPLDRLLLFNPPLPLVTEGKSDTSGDTIDWRVASERVTRGAGMCSGVQQASRVWSDGGDELAVPLFSQIVCNAHSASDATFRFTALRHRNAQGPNFDFDDEAALEPHNWPALLLRADRSDVACGMGSADGSCALWIFWGQYGSYLARLGFTEPLGGISSNRFFRLVESTDRHISSRLLTRGDAKSSGEASS
jgi:hypothetical protein